MDSDANERGCFQRSRSAETYPSTECGNMLAVDCSSTGCFYPTPGSCRDEQLTWTCIDESNTSETGSSGRAGVELKSVGERDVVNCHIHIEEGGAVFTGYVGGAGAKIGIVLPETAMLKKARE